MAAFKAAIQSARVRVPEDFLLSLDGRGKPGQDERREALRFLFRQEFPRSAVVVAAFAGLTAYVAMTAITRAAGMRRNGHLNQCFLAVIIHQNSGRV